MTTPVASLKTALYSLLAAKEMLPMVTTSRPVASVVTTMKISSLTASAGGLLVQELHRTLTSAPRASGPNSREARSGTSSSGTPIAGAAKALTSARSEAVPA